MLSGLLYFNNMSWSVNDIMNLTKFLTNKNQSGSISATKLFYAWNTEQNMYHTDLVGRWQARNSSKTGMNTGLIQDQTVLTELAPFTLPATIAIASGKVAKPSDFIFALDLRLNGVSSTPITHDQIAQVNKSVIDPPSTTTDTYYHTEYEDYYYMLPQSATGNTTLDYVAVCNDIVWGFTFDTNGRQVYNASGITGVPVIFGGVGYTTPTIAFSAPAAGGVQATGTLTVVGGVITAVVMTNIGNGYAGLTPTFTITGSSTTPANLSSPIVSVQPKWKTPTIIEITKRALTNLGVSWKDADFTNFGRTAQTTGD